MKEQNLLNIGRKISYLLRHNNENLEMDAQGWVDVKTLLIKLKIDKLTLNEIVLTNDKQRFVYNEDGSKIRANQGHSLEFVNIDFPESIPPKILFHGTKKENIKDIYLKGLKKMSRKYIHLSDNKSTARNVGLRHSKNEEPIILIIDTEKMYQDGYKFYISENKVWLTDYIPSEYIKFE